MLLRVEPAVLTLVKRLLKKLLQHLAGIIGPCYLGEQGFTFQASEPVRIDGYWEDGRCKAAQVTRLRDGETVTLRDQVGRPAWAGGGQGARGTGGGYGGDGNSDAPGDSTGAGQAEVDEWLTLYSRVFSVDADALVMHTAEGAIVVENRPWWFAQESGLSAQAGDPITLIGFYEDGDPWTGSRPRFEVGQIDDTTTGWTVLIRDENGRPG